VAIISTKEAADRLGLSVRRVQAMVKAGKLPGQKFGNAYMINEENLALVEDRKPGRPKRLRPKTEQLFVFIEPGRSDIREVEANLSELAGSLGGDVQRSKPHSTAAGGPIIYALTASGVSREALHNIWRVLNNPTLTAADRREILKLARRQRRSVSVLHLSEFHLKSLADELPTSVGSELGSVFEEMQKKGVGAAALLSLVVSLLTLILHVSRAGTSNTVIINAPTSVQFVQSAPGAATPKRKHHQSPTRKRRKAKR
jgi:excisionase family DNA binding protein